MNILHIVFSFRTGGIETMLVNIANEQASLNQHVYIIVINDNVDTTLADSLSSNLRFICLGKKLGSKNPFYVAKLNFILKKIDPDIVHLHDPGIYKYILLNYYRRKSCVTAHDVCVFPFCNSLKSIKHIFAISNVVKKDIMQKIHLDSTVVLNGIKIDSFKCLKNKPSSLFKMVVISRLLHEKKGQDILIKALKIVYDKGFENFSLDIIGEGPSKSFLEKLVLDNGLDSIITFLGNKSQDYIFAHLCEYDLSVQPSRYEGFGLTVVEAMAAKVPVLVSANEGPLEIIDNGKYGFYFKNGDVEDCAKMIIKILSNGIDEKLVDEAYNRADTFYNVKNTARAYLENYDTIISKK